MTGEVAIRTRSLTKRFGKLMAVENLSIEVMKGQTYGFLGPNGAGKSTTIKMLTGFLRPTNGEIEVLGMDMVRNPPKARERIGIVPDLFGFYPLLNAGEHLAFYGKLYGMEKGKLDERIQEILSLVGLNERKSSKVGEYSHGMRQRLVIAQALLNEPEILFLDEPTSGLDPQGSYETRQIIKTLAREGMTIFVSSHILSEVEEMCTHVGIVNHGKLVAQDSIGNLQKRLSAAKGIFVDVRISKPGDIRPLLSGIPGISALEQFSQYDFRLRIEDRMAIPKISQSIACSDLGLWSITELHSSLEEIFLDITRGGQR
ncbi:MAG: ABC transporter ATP-binding protein [Candidatus Thermoplasmatota archaeon]